MPVQIFLVAPKNADTAEFADILAKTLSAAPVAALFLPRGARTPATYEQFVRAAKKPAQDKNCAVLIEGDPRLVTALGADGLHVGEDIKGLKPILKTLQPDHIVGAGPTSSRHTAMGLGEAGVDYVQFGAFETAPSADQRALANWWTSNFQVPAVLMDAQTPVALFDSENCEFAGVGANIWNAQEGAPEALRILNARLEKL